MQRILTATLLAAALSLPHASPAFASEQSKIAVAQNLAAFGLDADIEAMTPGQRGAINSIAASSDSYSDRRLLIKSVLNRLPGVCGGLDVMLGKC